MPEQRQTALRPYEFSSGSISCREKPLETLKADCRSLEGRTLSEVDRPILKDSERLASSVGD